MKKRKITIGFVLLIAALAVLSLTAMTALTNTQSAEAAGDITFYDFDGDLQTVPEGVTVTTLSQSYFDNEMTEPYTLTGTGKEGSWYYVESSIEIDALVITGDVNIIISDDHFLWTNKGVTVTESSNLSLFSQKSDGEGGGVAAYDSNSIILKNGASLTNTANVSCSGNGYAAVYCSDDIHFILNGKKASITGSAYGIKLAGGGEIRNYGDISGSIFKSSGIYSESDTTIINYSGGVITGHTHGIYLSTGGTVDNYGTVRTSATDVNAIVSGIYVNMTADVINRESGLIQSIDHGIRFRLDGKLDNYGTIEGTSNWGSGVYGDYRAIAVITNHYGGLLFGNGAGVTTEEGCKITVFNSGTIQGDFGIYSINKQPGITAKFTNYEGGLISGRHGMIFPVGGELYNYGTIEAKEFCLFTFADKGSFTLLNAGTLSGVINLRDLANTVTFAVGSVVNGTFDLGTNPNSTISYTGILDETMIVGTVNGYAEIGNIVHDISGLVLPAGMLPGDMIVLIDGTSEKLTGSPANDKFTTGKYEFELKVTSEQLLAVLTVEYPDITDPEVVDPEVIEPEKPDPEIIDPIKPGPGPASTYFIIASADSGTTISPAGKVKVGTGKSATFTFSAIEGYKIASVKVDGKALSQAMMSLGYHTFSAVDSDHTIEVIGEEVPVLLTITVYTGKGYAEYSVNGRPFVTYTSAVILPLHADVVVRAVAEDGHSFDRWETPEIRKTAEISFNDIRSALTLDLFFTDSEEGTGGNGTDGEETGGTEGKEDNGLTAWMAGWLAMLLFIAVLLLILMMFRREYDVIKLVSSAQIIGEDRVRRKREYAFTIEGGPSGTVSYRITRDGEWKEILPNADGTYVIPKGEVVGELTIKHHRTPY